MFQLSPAVARIASEGFKEGLGLATQILQSEAFLDVLHDVSDGDINKEQSRAFARMSFTIVPILERVNFDAYALVKREHNPNFIYFNPMLLYRMVLTEEDEEEEVKEEEEAKEEEQQLPAEKKPKKDPTESIPLGKKMLNTFFTAVKAVHEFSHLAHLACGSRWKKQLIRKADGGGRKRKDVTLKREIDNVTYVDFGDMVEKKIFGAVVRPYHPRDVFAIDELFAIPNPKIASGHPIALTAANLTFSEDLSSLKVNFNPDVSRSGAAKVEINTGRMSAASGEEEGDDDCRMGSAEDVDAGLRATY